MNLLGPGLPSVLVRWSVSAEVVRFKAVTPEGLPPGWTVATITHEGGETDGKLSAIRMHPVHLFLSPRRCRTRRRAVSARRCGIRASKAGRTGLWTKADSGALQ